MKLPFIFFYRRVEECTSLVDNGRCDESCNTYECPLDYNDCKNNLYVSSTCVGIQ